MSVQIVATNDGSNLGSHDLTIDPNLRHYLRNRLNSISLSVQVLIRYPKMQQSEIIEYLDQICQAAEDVLARFPEDAMGTTSDSTLE